MRRFVRRPLLCLTVLASLLLTACGEPEDTRPGKPVAQRRAAFNKILRSFEPMGQSLRDQKYDADAFIKQAAALREVREGPWSFFGPDTNYPPTHANDKVWQEPEKFEAGRQAFFKAVDDLVSATQSRDGAKVKAAYEAVHDTCRTCHKAFKK